MQNGHVTQGGTCREGWSEGPGPGAMCRGSTVGSVAPSQEGADLSQGCCCDLKSRLAGATKAEAWRSSHTMPGL